MNRIEELKKRHEFETLPIKDEFIINEVKMINDDGTISSESKLVKLNEAEEIAKIPAVSTKIEYMQEYGTLDDMGIVRYKKVSSAFNIDDVLELKDEIIKNEFNNKKNSEKEEDEVVETLKND